ncbi:GNAT family N-acetyltransferase [Cutibacterium equinum]|uniref:GNAT family N-acetyltransferase n=1 Tax=Cutibacterium equinum TaxID=3016342 RepID=A0ABY7QYN4_9ACTN|nr:GNAT family N-acetyltransferase [Cutibacterium equinum]WCC79647.1 GNAT family N-acetyltransferase [Cutibacterium equinum]
METQRRQRRPQTQECDMSEHVVFRDMRPEDVTVITFGEPGALIDLIDRPDVVARVALHENRIVGYAVSWLAVVHRTRRFIDVEVHPDSRGRLIGTRLVRQIQQRVDRPLATKAIAGSDAEKFIMSLGGEVYAYCSPFELPRRHFGRAIESLAEVSLGPGGAISGATLAPGVLETLWEQIYVWMHESWSPVDDSEAAHEALRQELEDLDAEATRVALIDGQPAAVAFVFVDENPTVVAETVQADTPDGDAAVASAMSAVISWAEDAGYKRVNFDGHRSDPHFGPLSSRLPLEGASLILLEIPVLPSEGDDVDERTTSEGGAAEA